MRIFIIICSAVLFYCPLSFAQTNAPKQSIILSGLDLLGRPYHPTVGVLPAISSVPDLDPDILDKIGIAFTNGMKGNAYTPYSSLHKDKFDNIKLILEGLTKSELQKYYYAESVGVEYLARLDVNHFNLIIEFDTIRENPADIKSRVKKVAKVYNIFANLTSTVIDVATTDLLFSHTFSLSSTSRNATLVGSQTDSIAALVKIYNQIRGVGDGYDQQLSGIGVIDSLLEVKKDKAKTVMVNNNKIMNLKEKYNDFNVYVLGELFERDSMIYQHAELIGRVRKERDYNYMLRNFEVLNGESDIFEAFNAGKKLVCAVEKLPLSAKAALMNVPSITIDTFGSKVAGLVGLSRSFQEKITETMSKRSQMFNIVNRNSIGDIEIERAIQSKMKSSATQAGITIGADYILTGEVVSYQYKQEDVTKLEEIPLPTPPAKETTPAKPATPQPTTPKPASQSTPPTATNDVKTRNSAQPSTTANQPGTPPAKQEQQPAADPPVAAIGKLKLGKPVLIGKEGIVTARVDLRMVSVKTGEIIWSKILNAEARKTYPIPTKHTDKLIQQEELNNMLASNFANNNISQILVGIIPPLPILKVLEVDKKGIDRILVGGGLEAGITPYMSLVVIEETIEMVNNQPLKREVVVAELRLKEAYSETSAWKVKDGSSALKTKLDANAKLYCKVKGL